MGEGFGTIRVHPALMHSSSSFKIRTNTKRDKKRLVPIDLASTASYADLGDVLDEPATTPGQKSLMLECEHKVGFNFGERIINVRHPIADGTVRVVDVLRAIHDFLYEKAPTLPPRTAYTRMQIETAFEKRKAKERTDRTLHVANGIEQPVIVVSAPDDVGKVDSHYRKEDQKDFVKMDVLCGKSCFTGLARSSSHDFKLVFKLTAAHQP